MVDQKGEKLESEGCATTFCDLGGFVVGVGGGCAPILKVKINFLIAMVYCDGM